jgi:NADPH:quinone reductase-like Zn-dependent oxidoreductase
VKAFVFERTGDPNDVLAVRELPKPKPGPGEILVRVRLSPVHPSDMHIMRGRFGRQPTLPASPGIECVGVVEALGSGVAGPAPGTRVVLLNVWGSWRELIVSPAERVIPVPSELSDEDAAQALVNPVTAWVMTMVEHDLKLGDWLVQTAAGSTVGQLVLQLARLEGFRTVNIVRRRAQVPDIKALARISHRIECIGAANQRKSLCSNNLSPTHGAPRCRQSVAQISLNLHPWKDAK